jgi:hypothetical protein
LTSTEHKPRIEKLLPSHDVDAFDCGQPSLNRYLQRYALANQRADGAQTYVGLSGDTIIGFYSLAVGNVAYEDALGRLAKGLSRHPVPVMLLARLAVSLDWQGRGVGVL